MKEEKEITKEFNIEKEEWVFYFWIYKYDNSETIYASPAYERKEMALKYLPPTTRRVLVSFKISEKDFGE